MDRALYIAMTGATQTMRAQAANSHNLANAGTTGFRAQLVAAGAAEVQGAGLPSRVNATTGAEGWDARSGAVQHTGRELDIALREDAWLAVQTADGGEAYTKAGDLQIDAAGQLRTASGQAVLGDGGLMSVPPHAQLMIGADGTVSIVPAGQGAETMAAVGRLKVVSARPDQLARGVDGLMRPTPGTALDAAPGAVLISGAIESSNVNLPEAMVNMISLARQFELQVKLMKTAEANAQASTSLLRLNG
jgi:flagellar basal-body rod protein FlgF